MDVNHGKFGWASGREPWWFVLIQWFESYGVLQSHWLRFIVSYADTVVFNDGELCWASGCDSLWAMLSQLLRITVCSSEPLVVNHYVLGWASSCETLWVMMSQWLWNIVSYAELSVWESYCVVLSQWLWIIVLCWTGCVGIMVYYSEPVVLNHGEICWASGLWIMVCYVIPVVVNHGESCSTSGCESWCVILCK